MGLKIQINEAVTDTSLPKLYADSIMSQGSLFLMDLTNFTGDSGTSITNGGKINNVAYDLASQILGSGDANTLAGNVSLSNVSPSNAIIELTGKKGIHGIISKSNVLTSLGWQMQFPDLIKSHLLTNWATGRFFISVWGRVTRISNTSTSGSMVLANTTSSTSNYKALFQAGGLVATNNGARGVTGMNVLGNYIRNVGVTNSTGTAPASIANMYSYLKIGPQLPYGSFEAGVSQSMIIYRVYVEDLDVSGRTYAEVDAIDNALYTTAFASGGKFFADTFTDPSVLP